MGEGCTTCGCRRYLGVGLIFSRGVATFNDTEEIGLGLGLMTAFMAGRGQVLMTPRYDCPDNVVVLM